MINDGQTVGGEMGAAEVRVAKNHRVSTGTHPYVPTPPYDVPSARRATLSPLE